MTDGQPEVRPEDALQVAQRALAKVNDLEQRIEQLEGELGEVTEDLTALRLRVSEEDGERAYESLTLDEKIGMVREHAFERAADGHGRARIFYDDIMWGVFEGEPGPNHCYKLMRLAAGDDPDEQTDLEAGVPGFRVRDPDDENRHLAVDADRAKRGVAFYPGNKTDPEGGRSG